MSANEPNDPTAPNPMVAAMVKAVMAAWRSNLEQLEAQIEAAARASAEPERLEAASKAAP